MSLWKTVQITVRVLYRWLIVRDQLRDIILLPIHSIDPRKQLKTPPYTILYLATTLSAYMPLLLSIKQRVSGNWSLCSFTKLRNMLRVCLNRFYVFVETRLVIKPSQILSTQSTTRPLTCSFNISFFFLFRSIYTIQLLIRCKLTKLTTSVIQVLAKFFTGP